MSQNEEEVGWDEDDDTDDEAEKKKEDKKEDKKEEVGKKGNESAETLLLGKKEEKGGKKEEEVQSKADSEESYDLVSGQTSKVGTPPRKGGKKVCDPGNAGRDGANGTQEEESDSEEDWE